MTLLFFLDKIFRAYIYVIKNQAEKVYPYKKVLFILKCKYLMKSSFVFLKFCQKNRIEITMNKSSKNNKSVRPEWLNVFVISLSFSYYILLYSICILETLIILLFEKSERRVCIHICIYTYVRAHRGRD
jgi:hypothetical protein